MAFPLFLTRCLCACRPRRTKRRASDETSLGGVGSEDMVGLLKLKVWQAIEDIEPQEMELLYEGRLLQDDDRPLSFYGVKIKANIYARKVSSSGRSLEQYLAYSGSDFAACSFQVCVCV